jgi:hypothetical protein
MLPLKQMLLQKKGHWSSVDIKLSNRNKANYLVENIIFI